ncbi:MarR family transcriptional regulator [Kibdelosporangium phytohabitans]|uniref:MarR family transcriptional regulator n=1 Tax=Kibdelosporangium phytohabitans TaxID=860235 RepID=UPI0014701D81|nr:MarR family transcriptional regulator [Kibdelosporangium phytohabitans]MBE1471580.1 DNA-binding MarR family transcriptional regulator [Kibdelosporangium phytohabitans]
MADPDVITRLLAVQQQAAELNTALGDAVASRLGITGTDLKCLLLLLRRPRTPRELAAELRLSPSAITSVVDRLEKAAFAYREPSTSDRRQVLVTAVRERAQQAVDLYTPLSARTAEVLAAYTDDQVATLHRFAEQTVQVLREETDRLTER